MEPECEFLGIKIAKGVEETVLADYDDERYETVHLTQVALGDKPAKGPHTVFVEKDGEKYAIGTLDRDRCTQFSCDLTIATDHVALSHTGGSDVFVTGYRTASVPDPYGSDDDPDGGFGGFLSDASDSEGDDDSGDDESDGDEPPRAVALRDGGGGGGGARRSQLIDDEADSGSESESGDDSEEESESESESEEESESESDDEGGDERARGFAAALARRRGGGGGGPDLSDDGSDSDGPAPAPRAAAAPAKRAAPAAKTPQPAKRAKAAPAAAAPASAPAKVGGAAAGAAAGAGAAEYGRALKAYLQQHGPQPLATLGSKVKKPPNAPKLKLYLTSNPGVFKYDQARDVVALA